MGSWVIMGNNTFQVCLLVLCHVHYRHLFHFLPSRTWKDLEGPVWTRRFMFTWRRVHTQRLLSLPPRQPGSSTPSLLCPHSSPLAPTTTDTDSGPQSLPTHTHLRTALLTLSCSLHHLCYCSYLICTSDPVHIPAICTSLRTYLHTYVYCE